MTNMNHTNLITLYAPPQMGKTGLVRAFFRCLTHEPLMQKLIGSDSLIMDVDHSPTKDINDPQWAPVNVNLADITSLNPSEAIKSNLFRIIRKPKNGSISYGLKSSSFCHYVNLIDDMGGVYEVASGVTPVDRIVRGEIAETGRVKPEQVQTAWNNLMKSQVIIILLDPTTSPRLRNSGVSSAGSESINQGTTDYLPLDKIQYEKYMSQVIFRITELLSLPQTMIKNKFIAVCCSKVDDSNINPTYDDFRANLDVMTYIERYFGPSVTTTLNTLTNRYEAEQGNVRLFLLSSTGWYTDAGNMRKSNHGTDRFVESPNDWTPYGIIELFSHIFNALDDQLVNSNLNNINPIIKLLISSTVNDRQQWIKWGGEST